MPNKRIDLEYERDRETGQSEAERHLSVAWTTDEFRGTAVVTLSGEVVVECLPEHDETSNAHSDAEYAYAACIASSIVLAHNSLVGNPPQEPHERVEAMQREVRSIIEGHDR